MRTLLIVDDEKNIRLGLKAIIERGCPERYELLFASDGEAALGIIRERKVDIVITDIRMPGMDGLTMIGEIGTCESRPIVMILSGYDDFQYAKAAMQHEVKEYLLKPIVRDELFDALQRAERDLERKNELSERLGAVQQVREELLASQLNYIFLHPAIEEREIAERCEKAGWGNVFAPSYRGGDDSAGGNAGGGGASASAGEFYIGLLQAHGELTSGKAETLIARLASEPCGYRFWLKDKDDRLVILCDRVEPLQRLLTFMKENHVWGRIGLSERAASAGQVKQAYAQAREALKYGFLQASAEPALLVYDGKKERLADQPVPLEDIRKLANMLGTDRDKEMKQILSELLDSKRLAAYDTAYMEEISKQLNELVFDGVFHQYGEESVEILRIYKKVGCLYCFESIQDYYHAAEDLLLRLSDYVRSLRSVHAEHKEMKKAVCYIHENYHRDLNMAIVSNHVSLNYSYFSQTFKEFTGESFVVYLKRVRIQKAKALLVESDTRIYEIGELVGFENTKQFNRVFRELEGISAMEYREKFTAVGR
ncbi:response regulator transcription factor [Paenibacillus sacheonensis]|uniref:Response regulator n=1 Tax=Paenibacillus sacheonensis TaxID=742054 RepID=A0A7X5C173_9BACL|nr:response regulator [Paenibacillus sacheonensis]MBM7565249.1 two-component system response regulator YesN [Paenibacillus sacheonensis]NBC69975.1 response regulator [Paenibacillus sacheonensis]